MRTFNRIPASIAHKLGHYVYLYVDPTTNEVFYVGKGTGSRALEHLQEAANPSVKRRIEKLARLGEEPKIDILAHNLPSAQSALQVEAAAIDLLGLSDLDNQIRGWKGAQNGRQSIEDVLAKYQKKKAEITEPSLLIRSSQLFRHGMSDLEIYDITRGIWRIGERRNNAKYAFAVFQNVIRAAYEIAAWLPAGSTYYPTRPHDELEKIKDSDRWEFVGKPADESIQKKYVGKFVGHEFKAGHQTPYHYKNA